MKKTVLIICLIFMFYGSVCAESEVIKVTSHNKFGEYSGTEEWTWYFTREQVQSALEQYLLTRGNKFLPNRKYSRIFLDGSVNGCVRLHQYAPHQHDCCKECLKNSIKTGYEHTK